MLKLLLDQEETFNNETQEFETLEPIVLELEHSLISLSKWESRFEKPFLDSSAKSREEVFSYIQDMILDDDVPEDVLSRLSASDIERIKTYIDSSQSATTFGDMPKRGGSGERITSELIYYWMVAFNVPFECQYWHLNRLFSLIRICNIKQSPPKRCRVRNWPRETARSMQNAEQSSELVVKEDHAYSVY